MNDNLESPFAWNHNLWGFVSSLGFHLAQSLSSGCDAGETGSDRNAGETGSDRASIGQSFSNQHQALMLRREALPYRSSISSMPYPHLPLFPSTLHQTSFSPSLPPAKILFPAE